LKRYGLQADFILARALLDPSNLTTRTAESAKSEA